MVVVKNTLSKGTRRTWTKNEEQASLTILEDIVASGGNCENSAFRFGTMNKILKKQNCKSYILIVD